MRVLSCCYRWFCVLFFLFCFVFAPWPNALSKAPRFCCESRIILINPFCLPRACFTCRLEMKPQGIAIPPALQCTAPHRNTASRSAAQHHNKKQLRKNAPHGCFVHFSGSVFSGDSRSVLRNR
ncbi:unnamed protein product, partial [Laminaria digitata]